MSVNKESTNIPYNLGRLFAVLAAPQEAANPNINTTIKDRFFQLRFRYAEPCVPSLINLAQKHLAKLNEGQRIALNKSIGELSDKLGETFPKQLMLAEQARSSSATTSSVRNILKKRNTPPNRKRRHNHA